MNYIKIIKLGKKLVDELNLSDGVDTLGKWMAHYIAELIEKAEVSTGEVKERYEKECFESIIKLWNHIEKVPNINVPLARFSNILEVYDKITTKDKFRYFPNKYEDESNLYLLLAQKADSLAKRIVYLSFSLAILEASEEEKEWLKFDMLDDVVSLNRIIIDFEDNVERRDGILDIAESEKKELFKIVEEFKNILELIESSEQSMQYFKS